MYPRTSATAAGLAVSALAAAALTVPVAAAAPTAPAAPAATASDIVLNEVESNGDPMGDWVELANKNATLGLDISGWSIVDDDPKHTPIVFPAGTVVESGGYHVVFTDTPTGFGLGGADSVTLRDAAGTVVDTVSWTAHSPTTLGRLPDKTGAFGPTPAPTRGQSNGGGTDPAPAPQPTTQWPGDPLTVTTVDLGKDFTGGDMSGIDTDAAGNAYVVNNGTGTLYVLAYDKTAGTYSVARSFRLVYPDGTGIPDAEGVTVGENGAIYVSTERDGTAKTVSRPSVLRYEVPAAPTAGPLKATTEYSLAADVGTVGANAGLEAVEYVPGAWGGVYAVGVEATGEVLFVTLGADGSHAVRQRWHSPFPGVMALDYDEAAKRLRVLCDDACEGRSVETTFDGTQFVSDATLVARPAQMPNVANEGFASFHEQVACTVDGHAGTADRVRYLWADDAGTGGVSMRTATGAPAACVVAPPAAGQGSLQGSVGTIEAPGSLGALTGSLAG